MKALFFSIGTRGDAEPLLALAMILKDEGWEVACCFPEQFRDTVAALQIDFYGLDRQFLELLEGSAGKMIMGGSGTTWQRFLAFKDLIRSSMKLQQRLINQQQQAVTDFNPQRIFYHPKCVYPLIWGMCNPGRTLLVCPMPCVVHETKEMSTIAFKGNGNYGEFLNLMSYRFINMIRSWVFYRITRKYRGQFPGVKISPATIRQCLLKDTTTLYTISPSLFPRPPYWDPHLFVTGYFERSKTAHWKPERALLDFLDRHQKILFVTFGSMQNTKPQAKTAAILEVLSKHQIAAIINTSWGGLEQPSAYPSHIHFVNNIPYDWIFPRMYAVMHHGGSGTTHAACKHGCPSLIIPHIVDQYFWNDRVYHLGVGPKGIPVKKLSASRLEPLMLDLLQQDHYKKRAREIKETMTRETPRDFFVRLMATC